MLNRDHYVISGGVVVKVDGVPLRDDGPVLAAIDRLLKVQERRAKLIGLDAPTRTDELSLDQVDREIARLESKLGQDGEQSVIDPPDAEPPSWVGQTQPAHPWGTQLPR